MVPDLEPYCGSWIAVSRETGRAAFETYSRETAEAINQEKYEMLTAHQWLVRFNRAVQSPEERVNIPARQKRAGRNKNTDDSDLDLFD